ncbi:MAG: hypothetical protein HY744_05560 [Deltaproteobacteria bacterium]|nr:hypothetical protein [Deltaproteobacteria bacterium]
MTGQTQISAFVSTATKEKLERYAEAHGMKKAALVEQALLHHLQALAELPADVIVPARVMVPPDTFERVADLVRNPPPPTEAMKALMSGQPVEGLDD